MAITGGIKFFDKNLNLSEDGSVAVASSGIGAENFALDKNEFTSWRSSGTTDATTETYTLTYGSASTISRLFLNRINLKAYEIKYSTGSGFVSFTNVVGIDGSIGGGLVETANSRSTTYYEFDQVTGVTQLQITMTTTQTVDEEKRIGELITTTEIGTLTGFPTVKKLANSRNERRAKMLSGKFLVQKSLETFAYDIDFANYPPGQTADLDLVFTLFERETEFLVWLCGGRDGSTYFTYTLRGFRLEDIIPMQLSRDLSASYFKNVYKSMVDVRLSLIHHV